jgi:hypothetical protein
MDGGVRWVENRLRQTTMNKPLTAISIFTLFDGFSSSPPWKPIIHSPHRTAPHRRAHRLAHGCDGRCFAKAWYIIHPSNEHLFFTQRVPTPPTKKLFLLFFFLSSLFFSSSAARPISSSHLIDTSFVVVLSYLLFHNTMHFTTAAIALAAFASSAYAHMEMTNRECAVALVSDLVLTCSLQPSHSVPS